jgi:hypothetical protein
MRSLGQLLRPRSRGKELGGTGEEREHRIGTRASRPPCLDSAHAHPTPHNGSLVPAAPEHAPSGNLHGPGVRFGLHLASVCGCARAAYAPPTAGALRGPRAYGCDLRSSLSWVLAPAYTCVLRFPELSSVCRFLDVYKLSYPCS